MPPVKRLFDVIVVLTAMFFLWPVFVLLIVLVKMNLGSPIFFSQVRPGLKGKPFRMYKFRTMLNTRDAQGQLLPDHMRLPPFGRLLRATSLDELPELWNILRGEMSLVGPRPLLMDYLPLYTPEQRRRHEMLPGVTGWAQVNGRNAISWEEKFKLDVWYVDHWSFVLDLKILLMTVQKVFKREGISAAGEATMPRFMGSQSSDPRS
ncbi:sugar transferase [Deinococcus cellulosilyticus]|uniref:Sugar transferase n=1 Tax=Deinococcus cellulosilyticus (strain DSM 18568 / NBRC 106333 / KACC 11606 / 5516J-15) TaxID=1223518 RepID=A0A511N535_DEIC1|nr:sugar transferase [Deinococcus cellulosilyticus]GEM47598.1 sugar transferase [Deinococcus cellulosilyticus NBRC 106333 = KACC 11606]